MDQVPVPAQPANIAQPVASFPQPICPRCHFVVKPEYYYCPNCGAQLSEAPLGVGLMDQLLMYAFSLVLPWIAYLAITKWQGIKYLRSPDTRARQVGLIALILLIVSSVIAFWLTYVWIQGYIQSSLSDVNSLGF